MKRYYISPIVGPNAKGTYYPLVKDLLNLAEGEGFVATIKTNPDGTPALPWCLVNVNAANHLPLLADLRIKPMPDFPLDGKVAAIQKLTRDSMTAALANLGIDTAFISRADGYREILRTVGQIHDPAFDENNFDTL